MSELTRAFQCTHFSFLSKKDVQDIKNCMLNFNISFIVACRERRNLLLKSFVHLLLPEMNLLGKNQEGKKKESDKCESSPRAHADKRKK